MDLASFNHSFVDTSSRILEFIGVPNFTIPRIIVFMTRAADLSQRSAHDIATDSHVTGYGKYDKAALAHLLRQGAPALAESLEQAAESIPVFSRRTRGRIRDVGTESGGSGLVAADGPRVWVGDCLVDGSTKSTKTGELPMVDG